MTPWSPAPLVIAAATRARLGIVKSLRSAGATAPATATALGDLRPIARRQLQRLVDRGAVRQAGAGSYYLDERAWEEYRAQIQARKMLALAALVVLAAVFALVYLPR